MLMKMVYNWKKNEINLCIPMILIWYLSQQKNKVEKCSIFVISNITTIIYNSKMRYLAGFMCFDLFHKKKLH